MLGVYMSSIVEVAKLAGVSTATVSRVISGKGYVSENTKNIVNQVIEELGYKPSKTASVLARRTKHKIAVVFSQRIIDLETKDSDLFEGDGFYSIVYKGIKDRIEKNGFHMDVLVLEKRTKNRFDEYDGFLLVGGDFTKEDIEHYKQLRKPFVLIDQHLKGYPIDSVVSNGYDGAISCIDYLIKKGYQKIFHIHGPLSHYGFKDRFDGYVDGMQMHGFYPRTFLCDDINDDFNIIIPQIIKHTGIPDCIFAGNDNMAKKILRYLISEGYQIPQDIALVGFDDMLFSSIIKPALSTVKVYKYEMGDLAVDRLRQLLYQENIHPVKISLHTTFTKRESCR
ncbi:MAG: LacI family DNA-binding transcriptional regulator [bacterium]